MRLFGKNRSKNALVEVSTKPRKRTLPTRAEKKLERRIVGFNLTMQRKTHKPMGPECDGYRRPGSLKKS